MSFEFWICNDTHEMPKGLSIRWQIEDAGHVVFAGKAPADLEAMRATFQGYFRRAAPHVDHRTRFTLRLALADGQKILRDTEVGFEVFPDVPAGRYPGVSVIGSGKGLQLIRELGIRERSRIPGVIVVDDYARYQKQRASIDSAVSAGARAVFVELPAGEYEIGGSRVHVEECVMRPREFVSRATGHRLVEGCEPDDFKCWYDPAAGYFRPLLPTVFDAEGWQPILTNGNGLWGSGAWVQKFAAAEKPVGKGSYVVCQVTLAGRTKHNPVARIFARRLVGG